MEVFIYGSPDLGSPRDEVEDRIQDFLEGRGEVTGAGAGTSGVNVDIELFGTAVDLGEILAGLRRILIECGAPQGSKFVVEGQEHLVWPARTSGS